VTLLLVPALYLIAEDAGILRARFFGRGSVSAPAAEPV